MPLGLSPASVARFAAGILAALWAMAALATEYVTLAAVGPSPMLVIAIAMNVFLLAGASLAFLHAGGWRTVLLIALGLATIDRIVNASLAGTPLQVASALIGFVAISAVALIGTRRNK
jgi:hypothetical protein